MLFRAAALACAILCALPTAYAGGSGSGRTYVEGQLEEHSPGIIKLTGGDTFTLTAPAEKKLADLLEAQIVLKGTWLRLILDPANEQVTDLKPIDDPRTRPPPPRVDPARAKWEELALSLKHGDLVLVNEVKYAFNFYQGGVLVLDVLPQTARKASVTLSISKVRSFVRLETADVQDPGSHQPGKAQAVVPKPGDMVEIDGVKGYVLYINEEKIGLQTKDGLREIARAGITDIHPITKEDLDAGPGPTLAQPGLGATGADTIAVELDQGRLDYGAKTWTFGGVVKHQIAGKILIGARLELEARGDGRLLPPQECKRIIAAMGEALPAEVSGYVTFQGSSYYVKRSPDTPDLVIAEISELPQRDQQLLPPIFAGVPEPFEWPCRMLNPQDVHARVIYEPRNLVASSEPRAQGAIIRAYEGNEAHREAALRAIAASGQQSFLPFLLYQLYFESGSGEAIRRAFAAYGKTGEDWLLQFFKEKPTDQERAELAVPTGADRMEKKPVREPPRLMARALELLSAVVTDRTSDRAFGVALPYARDRNEELRAAARALFLDHAERSIPFMLRRLRSEPEVQSILMDIDEQKPGTIEDLVRRHCKPDPEFWQSLAGLETGERRRKLVERLRRDLSGEETALTVDTDIEAARASIARIKGLAQDLERNREALAKAYVTASLRTGRDRYERAEMLRRAVLLDPKDELARHELARILEEAARETMQGANVRAGPGVVYPQLRALAVGDVLYRALETPATKAALPDWIAVRLADSRVGYVPPDTVRDQVDTLIVDKIARPREVPTRLLIAARALDPAQAREVDRSLAEVRALQAGEVAKGGDWTRAYELYRDAFARAPERYRFAVLGAFLRANPFILAIVVVLGALVIASLAGTRKVAATGTLVLPPKEKAKAAPETKKVPS